VLTLPRCGIVSFLPRHRVNFCCRGVAAYFLFRRSAVSFFTFPVTYSILFFAQSLPSVLYLLLRHHIGTRRSTPHPPNFFYNGWHFGLACFTTDLLFFGRRSRPFWLFLCDVSSSTFGFFSRAPPLPFFLAEC